MSTYSVLFIDDDINFLRNLERTAPADFKTDIESNIDSALTKAKEQKWDCIVIDIAMPKMDGRELLSNIRSFDENTPLVFLTCLTDDENYLTALQRRPNDYIEKPVSPTRLFGTIRHHIEVNGNGPASFEHLNLIRHRGSVVIKGNEIALTKKEWLILEALVDAPPEGLTKESLVTKVWGEGAEKAHQTLDTHLSNLRKKIQKANIIIKTMKNQKIQIHEINENSSR